MIAYLDTSSLIKLYVREAGSEQVQELAGAATFISTSVVAYPEVRASLARIRREGRLAPSEYERTKGKLERHWPEYLTIEVTDRVSRSAGDLAEKHGLRGFDSLHLASYLALRGEGLDEPVAFSSFGGALNRAARREAR